MYWHKLFHKNNVCFLGLHHIITMDLHQKEIQGFFDVPIDNLRGSPFLIKYIQDQVRFASLNVLFRNH